MRLLTQYLIALALTLYSSFALAEKIHNFGMPIWMLKNIAELKFETGNELNIHNDTPNMVLVGLGSRVYTLNAGQKSSTKINADHLALSFWVRTKDENCYFDDNEHLVLDCIRPIYIATQKVPAPIAITIDKFNQLVVMTRDNDRIDDIPIKPYRSALRKNMKKLLQLKYAGTFFYVSKKAISDNPDEEVLEARLKENPYSTWKIRHKSVAIDPDDGYYKKMRQDYLFQAPTTPLPNGYQRHFLLPLPNDRRYHKHGGIKNDTGEDILIRVRYGSGGGTANLFLKNGEVITLVTDEFRDIDIYMYLIKDGCQVGQKCLRQLRGMWRHFGDGIITNLIKTPDNTIHAMSALIR